MNKIILFILCLVLSGCMTTASLFGTIGKCKPPLIYGGTRMWVAAAESNDTGAIAAIYFAPDLPFSFAADTGLLPLTFLIYILDRTICHSSSGKH